jgi:GxxExxY protein
MYEPIPQRDEEIAKAIIGAAIEVHRILGPGFLESIYRRALAYELRLRGFAVEEEKNIVVAFKDIQIPGQRMDLIVEGRVIVELKCVERFAPIHEAITLSYLKTMGLRLALMLNFKTQCLRDGIKRMVR